MSAMTEDRHVPQPADTRECIHGPECHGSGPDCYPTLTLEEQAIVDAFPWPCSRREAHGRHDVETIERGHGCDGSDADCQQTCPVPELYVLDCPGVSAHPLTQIGRPS